MPVDAEVPIRRLRFSGFLLPQNKVWDLHGCAWLRMSIACNTPISDPLSLENVSPSPFCQIYCYGFFGEAVPYFAAVTGFHSVSIKSN